MGLWPFGKKDAADAAVEDDAVDFASRVVNALLADGTRVRGKLVIHFRAPVAPHEADRSVASAVAGVERASVRSQALADLGSSDLATRILEELPDNVARPRSLEIVALHLVDDAPVSVVARPASSAPPKLASVPPLAASEPPKVPASLPPPPSSRPPKPPSMPPAAAEPVPVAVAAPTSRRPSGQMLIARGARLIPFGATPEGAGKGLVPLMRDAATKLEIGILRAYDLLVVRKAMIDEGDGALLDAIVPVSAAPLGFFAESRADELARWEKALGKEPYEVLQSEACAMVAFLLYDALRHVEVDPTTITTVVERMSEGAFPAGKGAVASLGRYLHPAEGTAVSELGKGIVKAVGHASELEGLGRILVPLLTALQDDLAIAAAQVRSGVAKA